MAARPRAACTRAGGWRQQQAACTPRFQPHGPPVCFVAGPWTTPSSTSSSPAPHCPPCSSPGPRQLHVLVCLSFKHSFKLVPLTTKHAHATACGPAQPALPSPLKLSSPAMLAAPRGRHHPRCSLALLRPQGQLGRMDFRWARPNATRGGRSFAAARPDHGFQHLHSLRRPELPEGSAEHLSLEPHQLPGWEGSKDPGVGAACVHARFVCACQLTARCGGRLWQPTSGCVLNRICCI